MQCRHARECGGCEQPERSYADQLARKHERLEHLLRPVLGRTAPPIEPVRGTPTEGADGPVAFRQKVSFVFGPGSGGHGLVLGHFAPASNRIVPVQECPVHSTRGNRIAFAIRDALLAARIPAAGPHLDGIARHVVVRTTADERQAVAMLVVTRNDRALRRPVRAVLDGPHAPDGFLVNVHDRPGPYLIGRDTLTVSGRAQVRETALGQAFLISPTAFFQTNVRAAGLLHAEVLALAPPTPRLRVLDLYGGSGLFGIPLAARGHHVTIVEENPQAIRDAEDNLRTNKLPPQQVRLICARAEDALGATSSRTPVIRGIDLAIVDPPRDGCPAVVLDALCRSVRPPRLAYVSCNPDALVAELPQIVAAGYRIRRIVPVDMFPHTDHIETVVSCERH